MRVRWSRMARSPPVCGSTSASKNSLRTPFLSASLILPGAGGGALPLLEKSRIPEGHGYAGFPVSGIWLRCDRDVAVPWKDDPAYADKVIEWWLTN